MVVATTDSALSSAGEAPVRTAGFAVAGLVVLAGSRLRTGVALDGPLDWALGFAVEELEPAAAPISAVTSTATIPHASLARAPRRAMCGT